MAVETNRWGIIYNPKAGSRKAQKKWNKIHDMIILVEEGDSKSVVYFGGVMKDDSDK